MKGFQIKYQDVDSNNDRTSISSVVSPLLQISTQTTN